MALGPQFKVNDDARSLIQHVTVASDVSGNFIIAWEEYRYPTTDPDIYAQRYSPTGSPLGLNFKVNDDFEGAEQHWPTIALDNSGNSVIVWSDNRNVWNSYDTYGQRYDTTGMPVGNNFKANDSPTSNQASYRSDVSLHGPEGYTIVWEDYRNGSGEICGQRYDSSGTVLDSNFIINRCVEAIDHHFPAVATLGIDSFVVVWQDSRQWMQPGKYYFDVYCQVYSTEGNPVNCNFRANDAYLTTHERCSAPDVASDDCSSLMIAWERRVSSYMYSNSGIRAQAYNSSAMPLGSNILVGSGGMYGSPPAIVSNQPCTFVFVWSPGVHGNTQIVGQRYHCTGIPIGPAFSVNDDSMFWNNHGQPSVASDAQGRFIITWGEGNIYAQRYDSSGTRLGNNFKVDDCSTDCFARYPSVAADRHGNFVITWKDCRSGWPNCDIYAQRYDPSGLPLGANFRVNEDSSGAYRDRPATAMDSSGRFIIVWEEYSDDDSNIYAQKYDLDGTPNGGNQRVTNYDASVQRRPDVAVTSKYIVFVWEDNRRSCNWDWDIYAKIVDWEWTEVEQDHEVSLPNSFELCQSFPNPFNSRSIILFRLKAEGSGFGSPIRTTLKIYNILGQLVRTLVNEEKIAGNHKVVWDGKDNSGIEVSSGIYFYRLKAEDLTATRKMVLLR